MKLSRTVGYALQAVLQLAEAEPHTPVPCSRLAADGNMPERFLLQILRNLVNRGILSSTRGVDGGYTLGRPLKDLSLLDVIEAADGPLESSHPLTDGLSAESLKQLSAVLEDVTSSSRQQLGNIKLSTLLVGNGC
jgi:Rrf2 family protein